MNKKLLLLASIIPAMIACSHTNISSKDTTSTLPDTSISTTSIPDTSSNPLTSTTSSISSTSQEDPLVILEDEHLITNGSIGGMLIDITNNFLMEDNGQFACSYSTSLADTSIKVVSSREESLTVEMTGTNTFILHSHKPGDSLLTIYNADGIISYNKVVHVRKGYSPTEILDAVCDNDIYKSTGIYGNYRFAISEMSGATVYATIQGKDSDESGKDKKAIFTLSYDSLMADSPFEGHFYSFFANQDLTNSTLEKEIKCVLISLCGDQILVYYGDDELLLEAFKIA